MIQMFANDEVERVLIMGAKFKFSHYAFVPVERPELQNINNAFEMAINADDPEQSITITVNGAKNTTVKLTSQQLAEFIAIMKLTLSED